MNYKQWLFFLLIFLGLSVAGIALVKLIIRIITGFSKKTKTKLDDLVTHALKSPLSLAAVVIAAYISIYLVKIPAKYLKVIDGALFVLTVLLAAMAINNVFKAILSWVQESSQKKEFLRRFLPLVDIGGKIFLWTAAVMIILKRFNYDISSLIVSMGVGSLAIGLAAQDTLANMFGGLMILFDQPFRVGDRIKLENGEFGDVLEIGLRSTKIKTVENYVLVVPNSQLIKSKVLNYYLPERSSVGKITVGVSYDSDPQKVKEILIKSALEVDEVMRDPAPSAFFTEFGDFFLNFLLVYWVDDPKKVFATKDKINMRIIENFQKEGIEIPYPIQTIYLRRENESKN